MLSITERVFNNLSVCMFVLWVPAAAEVQTSKVRNTPEAAFH